MKSMIRGGVLLALGIFSMITGIWVASVIIAKVLLIIAGLFFILMGIGCVLNIGNVQPTQKESKTGKKNLKGK